MLGRGRSITSTRPMIHAKSKGSYSRPWSPLPTGGGNDNALPERNIETSLVVRFAIESGQIAEGGSTALTNLELNIHVVVETVFAPPYLAL